MKFSKKPAATGRLALAASVAATAFVIGAHPAHAQAPAAPVQVASAQPVSYSSSSAEPVQPAPAQDQAAPYQSAPPPRVARSRFNRLKGATFSVSATQEWTTPLTNNASPVTTIIGTPPNAVRETVFNQDQGATSKPGVLASFGFHPVSWAGVELNYQFVQFNEQYSFNYSSQPGVRQFNRVPVAFHEATAAYQFHPPHIKFQPYVNIGGGAVDFLPYLANNQWRGAGLVETGFDIPTKSPHLAIRVQGRALIYRAPNFNNSALSTRGWVVTEEPTAGLVYRF